jgi:transposase
VWVDQGYTGSGKAWIEAHLGWSVEVVGHPLKPRGVWAPIGAVIDWEALRPKGFRGVLPRRWVVERTLSWFGQIRRLSRLRAALHDERSAYLCHDDPVDAASLDPCLTFSDGFYQDCNQRKGAALRCRSAQVNGAVFLVQDADLEYNLIEEKRPHPEQEHCMLNRQAFIIE